MVKHILVLGNFGYVTNQLDGQTVKTRNIYNLLSERVGNKVVYFDTQNFKHKKIVFFQMVKLLLSSNMIFYLPAHGNLKYLFPFIFMFAKLFRIKLFYFVIGGWLDIFLEHLCIHRLMLMNIDCIFSETNMLKSLLGEKYKIFKVELFPNFRMQTFIPNVHHTDGVLKLVFCARINVKKGLDLVFLLSEHILHRYNNGAIIIDFYGQINKDDRDYFYREVSKYSFVRYKGELEPMNICKTIERYDVMLFPTHYFTEGLPGTVLDAYMSGIPVIATKWKYSTEFIKDGVTGYIIPFENGGDSLCERVDFLYNSPEELSYLKRNAYKESFLYSAENAWNIIQKYIIE